MPEEMIEYLNRERGYGSLSEYIRAVIRRDQERRADYAARPVRMPHCANETSTFVEALDQLDKLKAILERNDKYFD